MGQRILLAPSSLAYGVANHFLRDLGEEWQRLGHQVTTTLNDDPPDWLVSVNVSGLAYPADSRLAGVRRLALIVDDPLNCYGLYFYRLLNFYPAYVDRTFCEVVDRLSGWEGKPLFSPHGAVVRPTACGERPIDLLFCGSYYPLEELQEELAALLASPKVPVAWCGWIGSLLAGESAEPICALLAPDDWPLLWQYPSVAAALQLLDRLVRLQRRIERLRTLGEAGLRVDLYGDGWGRSSVARWHRTHRAVSFETALQLMGQAKITLNFQPNFRYALHERLLSAMAAGSVVATDSNELVREAFRDGEELLLFHEELPCQLQALLRDEVKRERIAAAGREKVLACHTWAHRAGEIDRKLFQSLP